LLPSEGKTLGQFYPELYPVGHQLHEHQFHYQCDVRELFYGRVAHTMALERQSVTWDLMIAHPPCTFLSSSGLHWNKRRPDRAQETEKALAFALELWKLPIKLVCMENPIGRLTKVMRELGNMVQTIQPYQFGHDASKGTCLILRGLSPLRPTKFIEPRIVGGKPRWANQTDSGQNRLAPSEHRSMDRARTYQGIADAMASQWS
jgi:hypothetical protein